MSSYLTSVIIFVGIGLIGVLGVSVLTGFTRLFSFGNAGFMAVGAYASALCSIRLATPFVLSLAIGILAACVCAFLLGKLTLKLQGDYFLITTLGFGEGMRVLLQYMEKITGGAKGLSGIPPRTTLPIVLVCVVLSTIFCFNLVRSKYGYHLMAIREQEIAAQAVGVDTAKYKLMSFVVSAALCGLSGGLMAHYMSFLDPRMFDFTKSSELTITVIIGGLGSLSGSIIASIFLISLPELLRDFNNYRMLLYGLAVLLVILLRPEGLMGYREFSLTGAVNATGRWFGKHFGKKKVKES